MPEFRIIPLKVGTLTNFEKSSFTLGRNYGVKIDAPCIMWLITDGRTNIVVDAGPPAPEFATHHPALARPDEEAPARVLRAHGVDPRTVECVVLTHLHWDHVGEVEIFPSARFVVQAEELREAVTPLVVQRRTYEVGLPGVQPRWMRVFDRMEVVEGDRELLPGIRLVTLPGHTRGLQGVLVQTSAGRYLIAGDAVPLFENWSGDGNLKHIPSSLHSDLALYEKTLQRIEEIADFVLPGHDSGVFRRESYP